MLYWHFLLSLCVSENAWNPDPYVCTAICLVWPVSAKNIRKWLGNWFLCIMGSETRRRWSGKTAALHSALFYVESSLEALSPLGAGCWCSYTHTLQQQSRPGWTAGNSLSWQNSAFWQDSLLQQCLPVPAEGAAAAGAQLWQHDCSVPLPLPAQPCWSGIIHLIETSCASGGRCSHFILSTVGPSLAAKAQSEQFEPPNFITDFRLLSYTWPLNFLIFPFFFSSVQCSFPFYFQRNEQLLSELPSYCSGGNPMDLTTEVSVQQQTRAWPWCLPGCPPPSFQQSWCLYLGGV